MKFLVNIEKYSYRLIKLNTLKSVLSEILKSLLDFESGILSLTMSRDEISLIIRDDVYQDKFKEIKEMSLAGFSDEYLAITVDTETPGLNETGILANIAKKFSDAKISILTFSTYNYNFILYPKHELKKMETLIQNDDDITLFEN